jgi:hypothetical protein
VHAQAGHEVLVAMLVVDLVDLDPLLVFGQIMGLLACHSAVVAAIAAAQVHDKRPLGLGSFTAALGAGPSAMEPLRRRSQTYLSGDRQSSSGAETLKQPPPRDGHLSSSLHDAVHLSVLPADRRRWGRQRRTNGVVGCVGRIGAVHMAVGTRPR